MKSGREIATNNRDETHRFISKMYVPLSKSSRSIANHIVTNGTAGNFKGFISHPSSKCSFVCPHLDTSWQTGGILHTAQDYFSQSTNWLQCSFSSRTNHRHSAKKFLPSEQHLWFGSWPPYQPWGLLYEILWQAAVWARQLPYKTQLFISLGYEIQAHKQWKGAAACPAYKSVCHCPCIYTWACCVTAFTLGNFIWLLTSLLFKPFCF